MELQCMKQPALNPALMLCPYCQEEERIGIHSIRERHYRCHGCGHTFAETKGTVFFGCHYPIWLITVIGHGDECVLASVPLGKCRGIEIVLSSNG